MQPYLQGHNLGEIVGGKEDTIAQDVADLIKWKIEWKGNIYN